jgi:hypothetical protein
MSKVSKNIMEQIKDGAIKPRPRWRFVLMNILLIISLALAIVAGGMVMSLVFLQLFNLEWEFVSLGGEHGPTLVGVLPVIWMLLLIIMLLLSVWVFERMERGYRYHPAWLLLAAIVLSVVLGGILYMTKGAELIEDTLRSSLPPYQELENAREIMFLNPERGLLPGKIIEITLPDGLELEDLRGNVWDISFQPGLADKPAIQKLQVGQMILAIGVKSDDDQFMAQEIRTRKSFGRFLIIPVVLNHVRKN